jgi:large conductance mechanosensitive channel
MKIFQEFKQFAMRGNVMDLAVGVIIGGAFGKIVSSLVSDIIMPPISKLSGGINFTDLAWGGVRYGAFIQNIVDFLIIAAAIFLMVKAMNKLERKKQAEPAKVAELSTQEKLLTEIRDLLKEGK